MNEQELNPTAEADQVEETQVQEEIPELVEGEEKIEPEFDYKTGYEDLRSKHDYLKSEIGRRGNEWGTKTRTLEQRLAEYDKRFKELNERVAGYAPKPDPSKDLDEFLTTPREWVTKLLQETLKEIQQTSPADNQGLKEEIAKISFKIAHSDWQKMCPIMDEVIEQNPHLIQYPNWLEEAYQRAKLMEKEAGFVESSKDTFNKGKESVSTREQLKDQAQVGKGRGSKKPTEITDDMTSAEMEAILPHAQET